MLHLGGMARIPQHSLMAYTLMNSFKLLKAESASRARDSVSTPPPTVTLRTLGIFVSVAFILCTMFCNCVGKKESVVICVQGKIKCNCDYYFGATLRRKTGRDRPACCTTLLKISDKHSVRYILHELSNTRNSYIATGTGAYQCIILWDSYSVRTYILHAPSSNQEIQ